MFWYSVYSVLVCFEWTLNWFYYPKNLITKEENKTFSQLDVWLLIKHQRDASEQPHTTKPIAAVYEWQKAARSTNWFIIQTYKRQLKRTELIKHLSLIVGPRIKSRYENLIPAGLIKILCASECHNFPWTHTNNNKKWFPTVRSSQWAPAGEKSLGGERLFCLRSKSWERSLSADFYV